MNGSGYRLKQPRALRRLQRFFYTNDKICECRQDCAEMTVPNDNLRLVLISLNELKQVAVLAAANQFGAQLLSMGVVKGKQQLETFLETLRANIRETGLVLLINEE